LGWGLWLVCEGEEGERGKGEFAVLYGLLWSVFSGWTHDAEVLSIHAMRNEVMIVPVHNEP
jgi:hypothetical protein